MKFVNKGQPFMFTFIVVRGYAHRLLENGTVESVDIAFEGDEIQIQNDWQLRNPEDMNLDGWDYDQVRAELDTLRSKLPSGYSVPPQPVKQIQVDKSMQPV
jgi:hypothetical protein